MFNSWIQDKPLLKKIKTNTKSSCETNFWEGWQQISKEMAKWCLKRVYDKSRLSPQLYEKLPEKAGGRKFIGSSSKSLSLMWFLAWSVHQNMLWHTTFMYYYGWRRDSCWSDTQDKRKEYCKDNKNAATIMKSSKNQDIWSMICSQND